MNLFSEQRVFTDVFQSVRNRTSTSGAARNGQVKHIPMSMEDFSAIERFPPFFDSKFSSDVFSVNGQTAIHSYADERISANELRVILKMVDNQVLPTVLCILDILLILLYYLFFLFYYLVCSA